VARQRILAIDGGGVRGIIPAIALAELERITGRPAREDFAFLAGTSTGAVIAGALAAGIPAERLVSLYRRRGAELFDQPRLIGLVRRVVAGQMYDVAKLRSIIAEELGDQAAWGINDVPVDILVTSKALADGHPWYFVKDRPGENAGRTGGLPLVDCVTASAAAPTYFAPWPVANLGLLVDGGTGVAGNPVYQACVEAFEYTSSYEPAGTTVVSLGTGRYFDRRRPTWIWPWLNWILAELLRSPGEQQTELVQRHYSEAAFYRIDVRLTRDYPLDSQGSQLDDLERIGRRLAATIDWSAILEARDNRHAWLRDVSRPDTIAGMSAEGVVGDTGLEPVTTCMSSKCSNQLS
jgi:predicted acylesterase/phospholipase RssA